MALSDRAFAFRVREVVAKVVPCVVGVKIGAAGGSAVIVKEDGLMITAGPPSQRQAERNRVRHFGNTCSSSAASRPTRRSLCS